MAVIKSWNSTNQLVVNASGSAQVVLYDASGNPIGGLSAGGFNALNVAPSGANYVASSANSTTAQLAVGATFTGTIESVFNQQAVSILLTSDQNGTLTLNQFIDVGGTYKVTPISFNVIAGVQFSRSMPLNGNYFNLSFTNVGSATTTTLRIDVAYGSLDAATDNGNIPMSIEEVGGVLASARPDGYLRTSPDPTTLLYDAFDSLDTTNTWTVGGTATPTVSGGALTLNVTNVINQGSYATSQAVFKPGSAAVMQFAGIVTVDAASISNNRRWWGLGVPGTVQFIQPISNGVIFELDQGTLYGSVYSGGTRTKTVTLVRPTDGAAHRYAIYYKQSRVYFEIDNVAVGSIAMPNPATSTLSCVIGSYNSSSPPGVAVNLSASVLGVSDTGRNNFQISDGSYPWRKLAVNSSGAISVAAAAGSTLSVSVPDISTFGTMSANGSTLALTLAGARSCGFSMPSNHTLTATVTAEVSYDSGTTWQATTITFPSPSAVTKVPSFGTTPAVGGGYAILIPGGAGMVRLRLSSYTSGSCLFTIRASFAHDPSVAWSASAGSPPPNEVAYVGGTDGSLVRGLAVDTSGRLKTNVDGDKATYSVYASGFSLPATTPTDVITLYPNNSTKAIRIIRVCIQATQTTAGIYTWYLYKRSAAPSGGVSSALTITPHDTNSATSNCTALYWSTSPTTGSGTLIRLAKQWVQTGVGSGVTDNVLWDFGRAAQAIVLRTANQGLAINCATNTMPGSNVNVWIEWTEE